MTFQIAEYDCEQWKCIVFREYSASWTATYTTKTNISMKRNKLCNYWAGEVYSIKDLSQND